MANILSGSSREDYDLVELGYRVSFAEMQRVRLRKLQVKLVTHALRMHQDKKDHEEGWDKDLSDYGMSAGNMWRVSLGLSLFFEILADNIDVSIVQALKDYDYMVQCSRLRHDYFIATSERYVDRYVIQQVINRIVKRDKFLRKTKSTTPVEAYSDESLPIGGLRNEDTRLTEVENLRHRMLMAAIGAFLMLGLMCIMVLHRTFYTGLITTTAYVSAFGLVAA